MEYLKASYLSFYKYDEGNRHFAAVVAGGWCTLHSYSMYTLHTYDGDNFIRHTPKSVLINKKPQIIFI